MDDRPRSHPGRLALVVTAFLLGAGGGAGAQPSPDSTGSPDHFRLFPGGETFPVPVAAPREVSLRGALVFADRPDLANDYPGTNLEAIAALGHRIPVARLRRETPDGPGVRLEFETGVFSRFFLENPKRDLINTDFRVGAPLTVAFENWEARLVLLHVSSHLGDDYLDRFDPPFSTTSRDALSLLVARRLASRVRIYGGGDYNFHRNRGVERTVLEAGLEWDRRLDPDPPAAPSGPGIDVTAWPFAAADFRIDDLTDRIATALVAGVGLRVETVTLRLEARGGVGPSPMGQFRFTDERYAGLGLWVEP